MLKMIKLYNQVVNIPHQAAASGEQYAVPTKAVSKTSEQQPLSRHDPKKIPKE